MRVKRQFIIASEALNHVFYKNQNWSKPELKQVCPLFTYRLPLFFYNSLEMSGSKNINIASGYCSNKYFLDSSRAANNSTEFTFFL